MNQTFNWCFIGTGTLAHQVARQLRSSGRHKIVSCYTRNYEKGKAFGEKTLITLAKMMKEGK